LQVDFLPLSAIRLEWFAPLAGLAAGTWLLLSALTRNARTSGLAVTLVAAAITVDRSFASLCPAAWQSILMALVWVSACGLGAVLLVRGGDVRVLTLLTNVVAGVLVVSLAVDVVYSDARYRRERVVTPNLVWGSPPPAAGPDVLILVLDGYGRADVLRDLYGYDDPLAAALRRAGCFVAEEAAANYSQTALSLSSSLNMDYLSNLAPGLSSTAYSRRIPAALIARNRTFAFFRQAGYRIVAFGSEYSMVQFHGADEERRCWLCGTNLDYAIYDVSGLPRLFTWLGLPQAWVPHGTRRRGIKWTLDALRRPNLFSPDRPTLIVAHVMLPHPPFVLNADGTARPNALRAGLFDGDHWRWHGGGNREAYRAGYVAGARFLAREVELIVKSVSASGRRPVNVLVYGDHGPGSGLTWHSAAGTDLRERMSILLALRLSRSPADSPYPAMTPVNAVRSVVQDALGVRLPPIEDRSYFSTWTQPYRYIDVTPRVR